MSNKVLDSRRLDREIGAKVAEILKVPVETCSLMNYYVYLPNEFSGPAKIQHAPLIAKSLQEYISKIISRFDMFPFKYAIVALSSERLESLDGSYSYTSYSIHINRKFLFGSNTIVSLSVVKPYLDAVGIVDLDMDNWTDDQKVHLRLMLPDWMCS